VFDEQHKYNRFDQFDFIPLVQVDPWELRNNLRTQLVEVNSKIRQFADVEEEEDSNSFDLGISLN